MINTGEATIPCHVCCKLFPRSRSREPSEFRLPGAKLSQIVSSRRSATPDPHAYFSRPGSSLSIHGGRGGPEQTDPFRAAMEEKQNEEHNSSMILRSHTGEILVKQDENQDDIFSDRPMSSMSEMSLDMDHASRCDSRIEGSVINIEQDKSFVLKEENNFIIEKEKGMIVKRNITITAKETNTKELNHKINEDVKEDDKKGMVSKKLNLTSNTEKKELISKNGTKKADSEKKCETQKSEVDMRNLKPEKSENIDATAMSDIEENNLTNIEKKVIENDKKEEKNQKPLMKKNEKKIFQEKEKKKDTEKETNEIDNKLTKASKTKKEEEDSSRYKLKSKPKEKSATEEIDSKNNFEDTMKEKKTVDDKEAHNDSSFEKLITQDNERNSDKKSSPYSQRDTLEKETKSFEEKNNFIGRQIVSDVNQPKLQMDSEDSKEKTSLLEAKEIFALIAEETTKIEEKRNSQISNDKIVILFDDGEEQNKDTEQDDEIPELDQQSSTGYKHLDEFERKLQLMAKELEFDSEAHPEKVKDKEDTFDIIEDELTGSKIKRYRSPPTEVKAPCEDNQVEQAPQPPPRHRRSQSREPTPSSFLSAMTGGLLESQKFGSITQLVRGRSRSRSRMSRQSSTDRSGVIPDLVSGADQLVSKLLMMKNSRREVAQVDFDELFARGLAMSGENNEEMQEIPMIQFEEETGIKYETTVPDRGRKKEKKRRDPGENVIKEEEKSAMAETAKIRTRSREYAKPSDIKLSPIAKRDLFTGKLLDSTEEEVFLKKVTSFIEKNQQQLEDLQTVKENARENIKSLGYEKQEQPKVSPGKQFLESSIGQEMFSKSIESEVVSTKVRQEENLGDPADKNIPKLLKPDKLLKNEEFYENLRTGLKSLAAEIQEDNTKKYSSHLGRAEFGTLKRKVPLSRDTSKDKMKIR